MQLSKHYVQQLRFIQQQKFTLHSSVNILQSEFNFLKIAVADVVFYPVYKITCQG
jgi:hypothetical protein